MVRFVRPFSTDATIFLADVFCASPIGEQQLVQLRGPHNIKKRNTYGKVVRPPRTRALQAFLSGATRLTSSDLNAWTISYGATTHDDFV